MRHRFNSKWVAKRTTVDNINFASKSEAEFYLHLKTLERINHTKIIELQPKVYMTDAKILYKPDFLIDEQGSLVYIDVKGLTTPVFNLKLRLWRHYGMGTLRIVEKNHLGFFTAKEVTTET